MRLLLLGSAGVLLQALSGWWDVLSHIVQFRSGDPPLNPAHIGLYLGVGLVAASLGMGLFRGGGWRRPLAAGLTAQIIAGVLNEITHRLPELEESILHFTAHAMFTLGLLTTSLTIFIAVCIHTLFAERSGLELHLGQLMSGAALWLTASGSILYVFGTTPTATVLLGFSAATILGSTAYSSPKAYTATYTWAIYTASVYLLVVGYAGGQPYIPIGFAPTLAIDMTKKVVKQPHIRLAMVTLLGMMSYIAYPTTIAGPLQLLGLGFGGVVGAALLAYVGGRLASSSRYPAISRKVKM